MSTVTEDFDVVTCDCSTFGNYLDSNTPSEEVLRQFVQILKRNYNNATLLLDSVNDERLEVLSKMMEEQGVRKEGDTDDEHDLSLMNKFKNYEEKYVYISTAMSELNEKRSQLLEKTILIRKIFESKYE